MDELDLDPRVKRTRIALRDALAGLLPQHSFDAITLNDIAAAAGVNRTTIYKHYPDKFALLDDWIAADLRARLIAAMNGGPMTAEKKLGAVIAVVCECMRWVGSLGKKDDRLLLPIAQARIEALVLRAVEWALRERVAIAVARPELAAAMASAAICGAANVWASRSSHAARALDSHVARAREALAAIVVGNPRLPERLTTPLVLE